MCTDFQIDNARFEILATPIATTAGAGLTLAFGKSKMTADIASTGGCNVGIDLCDWILGTDSKIKTAIQNAADAALGSTMIKSALAVRDAWGMRAWVAQDAWEA